MTRSRFTRRRRAIAGQFIIIYIMGFFTMVMLAFTTISVGQVMVRKQWAQFIADSGAFAGASVEAEGLNTMSLITWWEFYLLRGVQERDRQVGYENSSGAEVCIALTTVYAQDIKDRHEDYIKPAFDAANLAIDVINYDPTGVVPGSRPNAYYAAEEITKKNYEALFNEDPAGSNTSGGQLASGTGYPSVAGYTSVYNPLDFQALADLTDYFDETVAWWYWSFDPCPCYWGIPFGLICTGISYVSCDASGVAGRFGDGNHDDQPNDSQPVSSYHFEKVLRTMEEDGETTFLWWVQIPAVRPILGMDKVLLQDIPPITAVARAKPYGGNMGIGEGNDKNAAWPKRKWLGDPTLSFPFMAIPPAATWNVQWEFKHDPVQTYKAKFTPVLPIRLREDPVIIAELLAQTKRPMAEFVGIAH
ncbi:MAG: hypothetical protein U0166_21265 [Acidobacteriota bacterium]